MSSRFKMEVTISGPQGAGKTTLARALRSTFQNYVKAHPEVEVIVRTELGLSVRHGEVEYSVKGEKRRRVKP